MKRSRIAFRKRSGFPWRSRQDCHESRRLPQKRLLGLEALEDRRLLSVAPWHEPLTAVQPRGSLIHASSIRRLPSINGAVVEVAQTGADMVALAATWSEHPAVRYAEPDYQVSVSQTFPNDLSFPELWGLHNTGQTGGTPDADIDAPEAWDIFTGSSAVVVASIDTGVYYSHPDLAADMWTNPGEIPDDGIDNDGNGYVDDVYGIDVANNDADPLDDHSHGTHTSGTIGAAGSRHGRVRSARVPRRATRGLDRRRGRAGRAGHAD